MKTLNLLVALYSLFIGTSVFADESDPGKILAKITSTASEKVCEIYSLKTIYELNGKVAKRTNTIYTEKLPDLFRFRQYLEEVGMNFRTTKPERSSRYIGIYGYDSEGARKILYELKGTSPNATLSHEVSPFGDALFEFILLNCPQYRLPWVTE